MLPFFIDSYLTKYFFTFWVWAPKSALSPQKINII